MATKNTLTPRALGAIVGGTILLLLVAGILSSFGGVAKGDVAEISGVNSISKSDFNHWLGVVSAQPQPGQKKAAPPPKPGTKQYEAVKQQVLQFLISADWIMGEAKDRGLSATDAEVKRQFEQTKKQSFPNDKAYQRFLKTSGQTLPDLLYRVKLDVVSNKIRTQLTSGATNVSNDEIKAYYDKNQQQFSQPERRDLEVILTKSEAKANEAKSRVAGGQKWAKVAKALSVDPASKNQGGKLLAVTKGQQDPSLDAAIFAGVQGKIAGPVKTPAGFYIFRVTKVTKATTQSLQQSSAGIKQLLVSQNQQKKLDQFSKTFRNKWRAKTDCNKGYVIPDCRNGREPTPAPTPTAPGQKKPVPGSSGANPPALDGTGTNLAGGNGGGPVIGNDTSNALAASQGLGAAAGGAAPTAPLALGGAPKKGTPAGLPAGLPGGVTPGGAGGVPQGAGGASQGAGGASQGAGGAGSGGP